MLEYDDILLEAIQILKNKNWVMSFEKLETDKERAEAVLDLPFAKKLEITARFCGKCEETFHCTLKEVLENITKKDPRANLALLNKAAKYCPASSLHLLYSQRSKVLYNSGHYVLSLLDIERAMVTSLPDEEIVELLKYKGYIYFKMGEYTSSENILLQSLKLLQKSNLSNNFKAKYASEIIKKIKDARNQHNAKVENNLRNKADPRYYCDIPDLWDGQNKDYPAASAALQLSWSPEKGRHFLTIKDISVGSVLIVETPYAWSLTEEAIDQHCLHCCRPVVAAVGCPQCSSVVFCGEECKEAAMVRYHQHECSVLGHMFKSKHLSPMSLLVLRIIIFSADYIMQEEDNDQEDQKSLSKDGKPNMLQNSTNSSFKLPLLSTAFDSAYQQVTNSKYRSVFDLFKRTVNAVFLMRCLKLSFRNFTNEVKLTEIILRFLQSCSCNAYQITEHVIRNLDIKQAKGREIGGALYNTISCCNHSCNPNVIRHLHGKVCVVRTIKSIKKGEEILDNYGMHYLTTSLEERQIKLKEQYFFQCTCKTCKENWPVRDILYSIKELYLCQNCSGLIEGDLEKTFMCQHCKNNFKYENLLSIKSDVHNTYINILDDILQQKIELSIPKLISCIERLEKVLLEPNMKIIRLQQALCLCWNMLGNVWEIQ